MDELPSPPRHHRALRLRAGSMLAAGILLLTIGATAASAAPTVVDGRGATAFSATFEGRAGRAQTVACAALGVAGKKIAARYDGTFSIPGDDRRLAMRISLEVLVDGRTGRGAASGTWRLIDSANADVVGRGDLLGVVGTAQPPEPDVDPPDPDLQLHGLLVGTAQPPEPDMPAQRLLGNFRATLTDGGRTITGQVGDPTADPPSEGELVPAVLVSAGPC